MVIFRRILLILGGLALVALATLVFICNINQGVASFWLQKFQLVFLSGDYFWPVTGVAVILLLLGIIGLFAAFLRKSGAQMIKVATNEGISVNISSTAVESVVKKAAMDNPEVKDVKTRIYNSSEGVIINLYLTLPQEGNFPQITAAVHQSVEQTLKAMTGISVSDIKIVIANVANKLDKR